MVLLDYVCRIDGAAEDDGAQPQIGESYTMPAGRAFYTLGMRQILDVYGASCCD